MVSGLSHLCNSLCVHIPQWALMNVIYSKTFRPRGIVNISIYYPFLTGETYASLPPLTPVFSAGFFHPRPPTSPTFPPATTLITAWHQRQPPAPAVPAHAPPPPNLVHPFFHGKCDVLILRTRRIVSRDTSPACFRSVMPVCSGLFPLIGRY